MFHARLRHAWFIHHPHSKSFTFHIDPLSGIRETFVAPRLSKTRQKILIALMEFVANILASWLWWVLWMDAAYICMPGLRIRYCDCHSADKNYETVDYKVQYACGATNIGLHAVPVLLTRRRRVTSERDMLSLNWKSAIDLIQKLHA